jgi:hypothetical protein
MKFDICAFLENLSRKFKFHCNTKIISSNLREYVFTFMTISRLILLRNKKHFQMKVVEKFSRIEC